MLVVRELWRYPVKSMAGELVGAVDIGGHGIDGDRGWGVRDLDTGLILTARREPRLLMTTVRLVDGAPSIADETGAPMLDDAALSRWIGRGVALVRAGDEPGTFENPMDPETESDWVRWQGPPGSFHDSTRTMVSLVSSGSLGSHDRRRFRANLVLDGAGEDDLVGAVVQVGTTTLRITKQIDRCVMVTRAQPGLAADRDVLRRVVRERANLMGIGARVERAGTIAIGDVVRVRATPT